jgi:hypothetical protein
MIKFKGISNLFLGRPAIYRIMVLKAKEKL